VSGGEREQPSVAGPAIPELQLLGQVQDLFILAEAGGTLWVIDQHVAHERVLFDRLTRGDRIGEVPQPLLLPPVLGLAQAESLALTEHIDLLRELGFGVEAFGPGRFLLRSVPRSLTGRNYEAAFRDLVDELAEQSHGGQIRLRREEVAAAAAGRSCKSAVKAGQALGDTEMTQLLADLASAENPYTCPHGRPVFIQYGPAEIDRLFGPRSCREARAVA
jgi:DNA mismatch repair protein MutL